MCPLTEAKWRFFPRGAVDLGAGLPPSWRHATGPCRWKAKTSGALRFSRPGGPCGEAPARAGGRPHKGGRAPRRDRFFALPVYAADGARAFVGDGRHDLEPALGDRSEDLNWLHQGARRCRASISATLLYWLGDQSPEYAATWSFLDRRIEDVMRFETLKKQVRENRVLGRLMAGPDWLAKQVRAPSASPRSDLPGALGAPEPRGGRDFRPRPCRRHPDAASLIPNGRRGSPPWSATMRAIEISEPGGPEVLTPTTPPGARAHGRADPDRQSIMPG